ncbi:helix-turn-helix domain-containing protein [Saliterribacillus persicus]|uniref:Helix-turn-helix protein n=1 Tax=Saliterribacillus persicus TaxID=930114 RepID=A0A368X4P3_9BACI|nr:helix-turn-helix domain-containing protein [Saliterribacillus persicus]RCW62970.1 helix-turn-helix protein [Saliterribacillus persicus]
MNNNYTAKYPPVLEVKDIKEILGIGRRQAYELVHSEQFHTIKVGKSIRIPTQNFFNWLYGESA